MTDGIRVGSCEGGGQFITARSLIRRGDTVFEEPLYVDFYDPDHSRQEHRYLIVGESDKGRLLMVS